jgi:hypothetical protein
VHKLPKSEVTGNNGFDFEPYSLKLQDATKLIGKAARRGHGKETADFIFFKALDLFC